MSKRDNSLVLYQDENGIIKVSVRFSDEDLWLTQNQIAEIYDTTKQNIGQHIKNILVDGELSEVSVVKDFFTTAADGKNYNIADTDKKIGEDKDFRGIGRLCGLAYCNELDCPGFHCRRSGAVF